MASGVGGRWQGSQAARAAAACSQQRGVAGREWLRWRGPIGRSRESCSCLSVCHVSQSCVAVAILDRSINRPGCADDERISAAAAPPRAAAPRCTYGGGSC
eukprot:COSAG01_NODE_52810_length_344_cov_0.502041_1_plen_100_part_01